jgi:hypothetical protein
MAKSPVDLDALTMSLRGHCPGVRGFFNLEVAIALEYLDGPGRQPRSQQSDGAGARQAEDKLI